MSRTVGEDPHADLVAFLLEQNELSGDQDPVLYEPIIMTKRDKIKIGNGTRIDGFCKLEGGQGLFIGRYVHVASFAHIGIGGGTVFIDDYCAVASGAKIIGGSNRADAVSISAVVPAEMQIVVPSVTIMKRYSGVYAGAIVCPGITLHEGAVLGAGAVATKDIPAWEIWAGNPAKFLKKRELTDEHRSRFGLSQQPALPLEIL